MVADDSKYTCMSNSSVHYLDMAAVPVYEHARSVLVT
jgi:hypothetical protein